MSKFTTAEEKLLITVAQNCALNRVTLILSGEEKVKLPTEPDDQACSGFFDVASRTLAVATAKPVSAWMRILLHEYNHLQQWIDDPDASGDVDFRLGLLWKWIAKETELDHETVINICVDAVTCELDCEKRSAAMIEELGLLWDIEQYIREANSYLYLYPTIPNTGKWCSKQAPYKVRELVSIMPGYFLGKAESYFDIPSEVERLILERCIPSDEETCNL